MELNMNQLPKEMKAFAAFSTLVESLNARFVLISYNSEGFITLEQMEAMLSRLGRVTRREISYNAYRASRNLSGRELHVKEYLFLLEKSS